MSALDVPAGEGGAVLVFATNAAELASHAELSPSTTRGRR
jgi:hypothetical protein